VVVIALAPALQFHDHGLLTGEKIMSCLAPYAAIGPHFDSIYPAGELACAFRSAIPGIRAHFGNKLELGILDLCCGTGRGLKALAGAFPDAKLLGIDNNSRLIEQAKNDFRGRFIVRDVLALESGDLDATAFDIVLITGGSIHHFRPPERARVLRLAAAALIPGGLLIFDIMKRAEKSESGTVHPFLRKYFRHPENGALVAVIYVTHYREDRIWQQNVVLEWVDGETNAPRMRCDFAEFYPIDRRKALAEAQSVGLQPHPIAIKYEPTEYLCFVKPSTS
jgi:SAM-dependent methyltransferase